MSWRAGRNPDDRPRAFIAGLSGLSLTSAEAGFLERYRPCGIIVFSRNYESNAQLRRLLDDARKAAGGKQWLVLVDQEGGRVQRLRGPEWPDFPSAAAFGALYRRDAARGLDSARVCSQWLSVRLREVGINTNCVPCLDVPVAGADAIIGNRAYGDCAQLVAALGGAVAVGTMAGGVLPVMKHIPGHGRARVDSHLALPVVEAEGEELREQDFAPFRALRVLPAAMSAHVQYQAIDAERPASISAKVVAEVIRGEIGFDGLVMSDDVSMQALAGGVGERARAVIDAGSDLILHCNGDLAEMAEVAAEAPELDGDAMRRYRRCLEVATRTPQVPDEAAVQAALQQLREVAVA